MKPQTIEQTTEIVYWPGGVAEVRCVLPTFAQARALREYAEQSLGCPTSIMSRRVSTTGIVVRVYAPQRAGSWPGVYTVRDELSRRIAELPMTSDRKDRR